MWVEWREGGERPRLKARECRDGAVCEVSLRVGVGRGENEDSGGITFTAFLQLWSFGHFYFWSWDGIVMLCAFLQFCSPISGVIPSMICLDSSRNFNHMHYDTYIYGMPILYRTT